MGTITINVSDEIEEKFRKRVNETYGKRKGALGQAFSEAILSWSQKKEYFDTCMNLLEEGVNLGGLKYKKRDELHDRN